MDNKIAGLYVSLAKAMNALESAGEDLFTVDGEKIDGLSASIRWDLEAEEWAVDQT